MAIIAKSNGATQRDLIPADTYICRCYKMLQLGTNTETVQGKVKQLHKVRIGWEIPGETKVFDSAKGEQPLVIDQEYTLSMAPSSHLRKMLEAWRGAPFTDEEAKEFDITKLIGAPCMLTIMHKPSKSDPSKVYENITSVTKLMKGMTCPPAVNEPFVLSYDNWDENKFNSLPEFIRDKMKTSEEYKAMKGQGVPVPQAAGTEEDEDSSFPF